jgi:hypothetical protein
MLTLVGNDLPRPWNKGLLVGQKKPLQPKHVWSIRVRLEISHKWRDLALFNLAIDSKLRACDLVKLRSDEVSSGAKVRDRATIVQTGRPVQFEITEQTRVSVEAWLRTVRTTGCRYFFPSRLHARPHLSTRQYARLVHRWVDSIGLESVSYGTHSMRRTKAAQIYRKTGNLRAVQRLLGHTKLESTVSISWDSGGRRSKHRRADRALAADASVSLGSLTRHKQSFAFEVENGYRCACVATISQSP